MNREGKVASGVIVFDRFRFDRNSGRLARLDAPGDAEPVAIGSRAGALLDLLAEQRGQIVSKKELLNRVWPGTFVAEANLSVQISALRRILDTGRRGPSIIQTVHGRGYRLTAPQVAQVDPGAEEIVGGNGLAPALPDKPSIAVLPFANLSDDPSQDYFADGMAEEIITALSRIRWLFVIAGASSLTYRGQKVEVKRVGRELGVRYLLEGSVRKAGGRVRITVQLIEGESGAHLWADRFEGPIADVFELQDRVAQSVSGVIEPALQAAETTRAAMRPTADLTAYDLYLRAYALLMSSRQQVAEALGLLEQAIARDARYGPALAWAALSHFWLVRDGLSKNPPEDRRQGAHRARLALAAAGDDANTLANAAFALAYFGEDIDTMMTLVDRALTLNPGFARGWQTSGALRRWAGQHDLAIEHVEVSLRLSPRARVGASLYVIGAAHFAAKRFDKAVPKLLLAIQDDPGHPDPYRYLAACYAHMGRRTEAREIVERLRSITPLVIPMASPLRRPEDLDLFLSGLRQAVRSV
jgi:adenylate cyclase